MDREVYGISGAGARRARGPLIPNGAIVMLNTTTIPSAMTRFSAADDRFIVCAGDLYSSGETGGSATGLSFYSQYSGLHGPGNCFGVAYANTGSGSYRVKDYGTDSYYSGQHGHSIQIDVLPAYQSVVLAKVNAWLTQFPANSIVLSADSSDWGLTRLFTDGRYMMAKSVVEAGGGNITNVNVANGGIHSHTYYNYTYFTGSYQVYDFDDYEAYHSHPHTLNAAWSLKAYSVAALTSSSPFDIQTGMIIFWETLDPPPGWKICDGTNGTPDMRNYFLKFCAVGDEGTTGGSNSVVLAGTLDDYNAAHSHRGSAWSTGTQTDITDHAMQDWIHNHDVNDILWDVLPPYYGLVPIMKA